jgi:hypothetical protein
MNTKNGRMLREEKTIEAIIAIYCHDHHGLTGDVLCKECSHSLDYARLRLSKCPFQEGKTTCAKCPVHCYKPDMRKKVRGVMGYSGPRMMYRHPILALYHFMDGFRKKPFRPERGSPQTD